MKKLFIASVILLTCLFIVTWYNGVFSSIQIKEQEDGGYKLVGLEFKGPYSKAGKWMIEVEEKLKNFGISGEKGFGIYYDDPKVVESANCRSFIGTILNPKDFKRIQELKSANFKVDSVPVAKALIAEFPIVNSFSYMIGPWKVYPVLSDFMNKKGFKNKLTMEIYDPLNRKIYFLIQYD